MTSTTTGQVLSKGYAYEQAYTVLREMIDNAVLDLVDKHVVCDSISLFVGYANERADIRRLDASGTAQYIDGCGHLRSSTSASSPQRPTVPSSRPVLPSPSSAMTNGAAWCASAGNRWHLCGRAWRQTAWWLCRTLCALQRLAKATRAHQFV
ncbi:MAG: hypothetical protein ACLU37_10725 [Collinsella sp.]